MTAVSTKNETDQETKLQFAIIESKITSKHVNTKVKGGADVADKLTVSSATRKVL